MSICGELLTRSPARDHDGAVDPNSHYRQKRESRASLDLFINGILAGESDGVGRRKSRHIGARKNGSMRGQQRAKGHHLKHERRRRYRALRSEVLTVQRHNDKRRGRERKLSY